MLTCRGLCDLCRGCLRDESVIGIVEERAAVTTHAVGIVAGRVLEIVEEAAAVTAHAVGVMTIVDWGIDS